MTPNPPVKGKKILIVEDEEALSNALRITLEKEGYEVTVASDGEEGAVRMTNETFDVALLDLLMPKMGGFTLLETLKEEGKNTTPVMVLSNLGQDEDIEKAKRLGVKEYLVKANSPINRIVEKVNAIAGK